MKPTTREYYEEQIIAVQLYIQRHLDGDLSLEKLARVSCFSPYHFHRIFQAMVGESVKLYIRRIKLERAALELKHCQLSVTDIAFRAGYETHEAFSRAFKKRFKKTPSNYRSQYHSAVKLDQVDTKLTLIIKHLGDSKMEVKIQNFDPMTVAAVRHTGPYAECCEAWQKLCSEPTVMPSATMPPMFIGICHDDPDVTDPENIRFDACVTVNDAFEAKGVVTKQTIEAGQYAVLRHVGSYSKLHDCYKWLYGQWLPQSGYQPKSAPSMEIYRNSPENTPEDELVTDICVPLN